MSETEFAMIYRLLALIVLIPLSSTWAQDDGPPVEPEVVGNVWYCDPVNGVTPTSPKDAARGNGSKALPWGSFESVVKARLVNGADPLKGKIHAGDTVKLLNGDHGRITFQSPEYQNTADITVEAEEGESPTISQVAVKFAKNWTWRGITFQRPTSPTGPGYILFRGVDVTGFTIEQCRFQSIEDATVWTDADWETKCAQFGAWLSGSDNVIADNRFYALENCVYVEGSNILVDKNRCELFLNDGIEFQASDLLIVRNRIADQYDLPSNKFHHDGMQGWNYTGKTLTKIVIDSNFVARSTGKYKSIPAISSNSMQGISIFDGAFSNVRVTNNVAMVTALHGIALYGCVDSVIEQNTVISQNLPTTKPARISVAASKPKFGSIQPKNIIVRNNIAPTFALTPMGVELSNNFAFVRPNKPYQSSFGIVDPARTFTKYEPATATFNLAVRDDSPAAGAVIVTRGPGAGARQ